MKKLSLETLRNDKRTRNTVICVSVGAVLVLAAAVTVPVMLHNRAPIAQAAEPSVTVTEQTTAETAAAAPTSEAVTVPTVSETTEPTSAASPMGDSVTEKKKSPKALQSPLHKARETAAARPQSSLRRTRRPPNRRSRAKSSGHRRR